MNWNGRIDGETPTQRTIQLLTSWRIYGGLLLFTLALVAPPALGYPRTYYVGFLAGAFGHVIADNLIATATE